MVYLTALLILMCTAWLVLAGTQVIRNVGDMARFGTVLFQLLAFIQMALVVFLSALGSASAVAQEKDRRTLILLLLTRLNNSELVLGKLLASLLDVLVMVGSAIPLFMLTTWLGGVTLPQVGRVFAVTFASAILAGSLGSTLALWREKTFQTLAMTALVLVIWLGVWEAVFALGTAGTLGTAADWPAIATACSPIRAMLAATEPILVGSSWAANPSFSYVVVSVGLTVALNGIAIWRVRVWNPSREVRPGQQQEEAASIWGVEHDLEAESGSEGAAAADPIASNAPSPEAARAGHVDARVRAPSRQNSRRVWDNPILWREICTWAYGRKVLIIRVIYLLMFGLAALAVHSATADSGQFHAVVDPISNTARVLAPLLFVSLVIVNALAVTSVTNERDGQALDLLLVTDLSPKEFVFGKIGGVAWVTKEMIVLPLLLCGYLWFRGATTLENTAYLMGGVAVMNFFVAVLGVHCGMTYANSRTAIGVSLGVVFFLFLGVVTCIVMMISFSSSFQTQLVPFLAFILGGGVGLYVSLGARNPSPAILLASLVVPFATFFAITSFVLPNQELTVFLVATIAYSFTTAAMLIPAIASFDIAMGRTRTAGDE